MKGEKYIVGPGTHALAGPVPGGWTAYRKLVRHPRDRAVGMLAMCQATGIHAMIVDGTVRSVPEKWALRQVARLERSAQ